MSEDIKETRSFTMSRTPRGEDIALLVSSNDLYGWYVDINRFIMGDKSQTYTITFTKEED